MGMLKFIIKMVLFLKVLLIKKLFFHMEMERWNTHLEIFIRVNGQMENSKEWVLITGEVVKNIMDNILKD